MIDKPIAIYVFIDDLIKRLHHQEITCQMQKCSQQLSSQPYTLADILTKVAHLCIPLGLSLTCSIKVDTIVVCML